MKDGGRRIAPEAVQGGRTGQEVGTSFPGDEPTIRSGSVEHWAAARPDAIAVVEGDRQWTWHEWNGLADRLATALSALGLRAGDVIAIRSRVRFEWCVLDVAAAKLGCALLCVNWRLTPVETAYILKNGSARAIVCDDDDPGDLAVAWQDIPDMVAISIGLPAWHFHRFEELLTARETVHISRADAKLVVYTSGTTGAPKGVVTNQPSSGTEASRKEYLSDVMQQGNQQPGDVVLVCLPLHHGMGAGLIRGAIMFGNKTILLRRYEAELALQAIERHRVTFWFAVPTMFKRMAALGAPSADRFDLSSIRSLMTGTAPVSIEIKRWVMAYFGDCLTEGYGSTETGMISYLLPHEQMLKPGSSGRPYKNVTIKIVDINDNTLLAGETGEILVLTPFCISGYLGGKPLGPDVIDTEGFFRTGDVGYLDDENYLFITDRVKDMIISGGVNIYPAEIEAVLLSHPDVVDAAIIGIPNDEFGEEVAGFLEVRAGTNPSEADLLQFCRASLASYKRPRRLVVVEELPRNTMGKVLKPQLRAPFWHGHERKV